MWYQPIQTISLWGVTIQVWGLMLAIGVMGGWYLFDYNLWWRKIKYDSSWLVLGVVVFGLIGARLVHVLLNWEFYANNWWSVFQIWNGGMASYGAYLFIFIYLYFFLKQLKDWANDMLDAAMPALMLGLFLARTGCLLINDHIGKITNLPWGINVDGYLRHPLSMYYMIAALLIFVFISTIFYQNKFRGRLFWITIALYGISRLFIDFFFKDFQGEISTMHSALISSGLFFIAGIAGWLARRRLF